MVVVQNVKYFDILVELPKITREFYCVLIRYSNHSKIYVGLYVYDEVIKRFLSIPKQLYF